MLGGHFCDVMLGLITEPLRFSVNQQIFLILWSSKTRWKAQKSKPNSWTGLRLPPFKIWWPSLNQTLDLRNPSSVFWRSRWAFVRRSDILLSTKLFWRIAPNCKRWGHFTSWTLMQIWTKRCSGNANFIFDSDIFSGPQPPIQIFLYKNLTVIQNQRLTSSPCLPWKDFV